MAGTAFWTEPGIGVLENNGVWTQIICRKFNSNGTLKRRAPTPESMACRLGPAITVFRDPGLLTVFDSEHSESEERWISIGKAANEALLVVVYAWLS